MQYEGVRDRFLFPKVEEKKNNSKWAVIDIHWSIVEMKSSYPHIYEAIFK